MIPGRNSTALCLFLKSYFPRWNNSREGQTFRWTEMKISAEVLPSLWNDVVILQKIQIRKASFKTTQANISFGRLDFSNWTKTMGNRDAWKSWLERAPIFFLSYKISHFLLYKIFLLLSYKQLGMPAHTFRTARMSRTMSSFERLPLYQKGLPWTKRGPVVASLERTDAATCGKF